MNMCEWIEKKKRSRDPSILHSISTTWSIESKNYCMCSLLFCINCAAVVACVLCWMQSSFVVYPSLDELQIGTNFSNQFSSCFPKELCVFFFLLVLLLLLLFESDQANLIGTKCNSFNHSHTHIHTEINCIFNTNAHKLHAAMGLFTVAGMRVCMWADSICV